MTLSRSRASRPVLRLTLRYALISLTLATLFNGDVTARATMSLSGPTPLMSVDIPVAGELDSGTFAIGGWALTPDTSPAPGVDAVHVWAMPVNGGGLRFLRLLGAATLGISRPDVGTAFGAQFATAGYYLTVRDLPRGTWDLLVYPRKTGDTSFAAPTVVRITVLDRFRRSILTGTDQIGGPHVRRVDGLDSLPPVGGALTSFFAFDPSSPGGVRVAEGDVNGDGVPDYIVGTGAGVAPEVRIIDGASGGIRNDVVPFESTFRGGVFVAAGDVNGDGYADVIVGSGEGRGGEIKVFSGWDLRLLVDVLVFDPSFLGGVHVAAGDVNGDGYADLIAGTGPGGGDVIVVNPLDLSILRSLTPYPGSTYGVWVAAGDVTGDGFADVVTGLGPGGGVGRGPHVRVFDGRTGAAGLSFFALDSAFGGGVHVAAGDVNDDGRADLITGPGPGFTSYVQVYNGASGMYMGGPLPVTSDLGGIFVATAVPVNRMAIDTPAAGAAVHGAFPVAGWAFEDNHVNTGIDAIHVWAIPVGAGAPVFLGGAITGHARPDVAALYGTQYTGAGFHLTAPALPAGDYDIAVFAHGAKTGTFNLVRVVRIAVTP